jgi:hypothetical protein
LSRSVSASIKISDSSPEEVVPLLSRRTLDDYYEGGATQEVLNLRAMPNGNVQWDVIDHLAWGRLTRSAERDNHLAPQRVTVTVTDPYGQVIRYDHHLTSESGDTLLTTTATLEVESSAPRGILAGQWRTDGWTRQGVARTLGHIRQEFERQRNAAADSI